MSKRNITNRFDEKNRECTINASMAHTTFGSLEYRSVMPNRNGGRAINTIPQNIITKLRRSIFSTGSFKNKRAQNTVYIGDVEAIIVASAIVKCFNETKFILIHKFRFSKYHTLMANWKTTLPVAPIIDLTIKARITVFLFFNLFHVGGFFII